MEKLKIVGNGPLNGDITVSGAKNAALPILCASLLTADTLRLTNVPQLRDVLTTQKLLQGMGARVMTDNVHEYELTASDIHQVVGRLPVRSCTSCAQDAIMRRANHPPTSTTTKAMVAQLKVMRAPRSRLPGSFGIASVGSAV